MGMEMPRTHTSTPQTSEVIPMCQLNDTPVDTASDPRPLAGLGSLTLNRLFRALSPNGVSPTPSSLTLDGRRLGRTCNGTQVDRLVVRLEDVLFAHALNPERFGTADTCEVCAAVPDDRDLDDEDEPMSAAESLATLGDCEDPRDFVGMW